MEKIKIIRHELASEERISYETERDSKISKNFLVKYDIINDETKSFFINSFQTIGWSDPFPDDYINITGSSK